MVVEAQTTTQEQQTTTTLRDRFSLPDSPTSFEYLSDNGWNFIMEYPVSNDVADPENDITLTINIYDKGCRYNDGDLPIELILVDADGASSSSSSSSSVPVVTTDVTFLPTSSTNDNEKLFTARLDLTLSSSSSSISSLIEAYPSLYDSENQDIQFCVRVSLLISETIEVNFVESLVKINVIFDGTFVINSIFVDAKERLQKSAKLVYGVVAYLCNDQYLPIRRMDQNKMICDQHNNNANPTTTTDDDDTNEVIISAPALMYKICNSNSAINNNNNNEDDEEENTTTSISSSTSSASSSTSSTSAVATAAAAESVEHLSFPQGSIIRVCVRADNCSMGQVEVKNIESLLFEAGEPIDHSQMAVENGSTALTYGLSEMMCQERSIHTTTTTTWVKSSQQQQQQQTGESSTSNDDLVRICAVETVLTSEFFIPPPSSSLPVSLTVNAYGHAILQFKKSENNNNNNKSRRRRRRRDLSVRRHHKQKQQQQQQEQEQEQHLPSMRRKLPTAEIGLQEYWNLPQPTVVFDGLDFDLEYQVSNGITNDMVQIELWDKDCQLGGGGEALTSISTSTSTSHSSSSLPSLLEVIKTELIATTGIDGDGEGEGASSSSSPLSSETTTQRFRTTVRWKTEDMNFGQELKDSPFFTESSDGSFAQIFACVRCQLHISSTNGIEDGGMEVNFVETPVNVNIDFQGGVSLGVGFHLTATEDPCIADLQRLSTGGRGYGGSNYNDDIYFTPMGDYSSMTLYKMLVADSDADTEDSARTTTLSSIESSDYYYTYLQPFSIFSSSSSTVPTITNCLILGMSIFFLEFSLI